MEYTSHRVVSDTPSPAARPPSSHYPALDGVRGVAVLVVMFHNICYMLQSGQGLPFVLLTSVGATGWVGVQLFFALSGFLITGILLDARGSRHFFRTFYIRRTFRIFPLYYAFLAFALLIAPLILSMPAWTAAA